MNSEYQNLPSEDIVEIHERPFIEHLSHMRCGAYASEWIARTMGLEVMSSNTTNESPWFDYLRPMLPLTIVGLLKKYGLESYSYSVASLSDDQKLAWLKNQITTHKKPVLILIKTTTLHWVVVAGYSDSKEEFYVYDSNFGENSINPEVPVGNKQIDYTRLLIDWQGAYIFTYIAVMILTDRLHGKTESETLYDTFEIQDDSSVEV